MNNSENFINKYLSKPNKTGGYKLNDINKEAETTSDLDDLSELQNHDDVIIRAHAARNHNCTSAHIDKALNDSSGLVRQCAALSHNATKEHLDKALNDEDVDVRDYAAENPNCTKEHLIKALNDRNLYIRRSAKRNPNYKKFFPNGHT